MTLCVRPHAGFSRQLLDCASPLALSTNRNNPDQGNIWVPPARNDVLTRKAETQPRQGRHLIPFLIVNRNNRSERSVCFSVKPVVNEG